MVRSAAFLSRIRVGDLKAVKPVCEDTIGPVGEVVMAEALLKLVVACCHLVTFKR